MKASDLPFLADVLDLMLDAVCVVGKKGEFVFVNAAFERIFGYRADEVIGTSAIDLVFDEDKALTLEAAKSLMSGKAKPVFENRWVSKDGRVVHVLWSAQWSQEHQVRIAVAHDITERKMMEALLYHTAGHDPLTELPNRFSLLKQLQVLLDDAPINKTDFALLFIDVDGFKEVNDYHGHDVGDQLLMLIAQRLRLSVRASDMVGRLGGDEFLILLQGSSNTEDVFNVAEGIRLEFEEVFELGDILLSISLSIGVACYPDHGKNHTQLIQRADQAMYKVKKLGGNRIVFADDH